MTPKSILQDMKTRLGKPLAIALCTIILGLSSGCYRNDATGVREMLTDYWRFVYSGQTLKAYMLLTNKSRSRISYKEFADRISWGPERTALKDSLWKTYSPLCDVKVGAVRVSGDSALASVLLTFPDLPERISTYSHEADSLFPQMDSLARKEWIIRKIIPALEKRSYRPFIMHLNLTLVREWGGWRLIYNGTPEDE